MKIINLMGDAVRILRNPNESDGSFMSFRSYSKEYGVDLGDGNLSGEAIGDDVVDNLYILTVRRGSQLPHPESDTVYIVPAAVALASPGRNDLLFPTEIVEGTESKPVYKMLGKAVD